jgi:hypothetical protein
MKHRGLIVVVVTVLLAACSTRTSIATRPATTPPSTPASTKPDAGNLVQVVIGSDAGWITAASASPTMGAATSIDNVGSRPLRLGDLRHRELLGAVAHTGAASTGGPPLAAPLAGDRPGLLYLGRAAASSSWPDLHLAAGGRDSIVATAATSFAVSPRGLLATAVASAPSTKEDPATTMHLQVRSTIADADVMWSPIPSRYRVEAWAGDHLLVTRSQGESSPPDLLRFDGPNDQVVLARAATLIGLSPDGQTAAIDRVDPNDSNRNIDELIDVASGKPVGTIDTSRTNADVLLGAGVWDTTGFVTWGYLDGLPSLFTFATDRLGLIVENVLSLRTENVPSLFSPTRGADGSIVALAPALAGPHTAHDNTFLLIVCAENLAMCSTRALPGNDRVDIVRNASR